MKTEVSPLGAFCILLAVNCWNICSETEKKSMIKRQLVENNALQVQEALSDLDYLVKSVMWRTRGIGCREIDGLLQSFMPDGKRDGSIADKARAELASFFAEMFSAGHFEQLPSPGFEYNPRPDIIVERRVLDDKGQMHAKGP